VAARGAGAAAGDAGDWVSASRFAGAANQFVAAIRLSLSEAGMVDSHDALIEYRWARDLPDQLPEIATDLVHCQVAVIATPVSTAAPAVKPATDGVPIVFQIGDDPVMLGLVASLNRPEGNVTGVSDLTFESWGRNDSDCCWN
jgi:putative ABC transport system substrate-binding protein